ncbi:MAG: sugar phosphate isomerase/epimerase family protein [Promethearchaeota archaeon]
MRIAVSTYSLRDEINKIGMKGVAEFLNELDVNHVEINNVFTKPEKLIDDVKVFKDHGIDTILLTVDGNNFFMPDEEDREDQFNFMKPWLEAANKAGIKMVRSNMGHAFPGIYPNPDDALEDLITTFKPIQELAESLGITYVFENHGGLSSDIEFQLKFIKRFTTDMVGFLLDTGNYKPKSQVYDNILKLGKTIKIIHAKTYSFDKKGNEKKLDFERIISLLKQVGYDGFYSIEFEGKIPNRKGVEKTLALLKRYL